MRQSSKWPLVIDTEVEAPQVAADLQPGDEVRAAVPLTRAAVLASSNAA